MQVGFRIGTANDSLRLNRDGTAPRPLAWTAWYPADANSIVTIPAEKKSWFTKEAIAIDAPIAHPGLSLPLVLLSHGTGTAAAVVEWLGFRLARIIEVSSTLFCPLDEATLLGNLSLPSFVVRQFDRPDNNHAIFV